MNGAFYIGATGLQAQQRGLDVIANNVANINTNAFKRSEIRFAELVTPTTIEDRRPLAPNLPEALTGVQAQASPRILEQGELRGTGMPFDLAVSGDGFIEVLGPGGQTWLWRGGTLRVNGEGLLETEGGLILKALIDVPEDSTSLAISRDGVVTSISTGSDEAVELGTIGLVMPHDPNAMEPIGSGFYRVAGDQDLVTLLNGEDGGVLVLGSLEASNVELTTEMVTLLLMQRAYGANAQVLQAGDQLMQIANGLRR